MKKAFPVSLDEDMIGWIKEQVKRGLFRNRSHLVENALKDFKNKVEGGTLRKFIEKP